MWRRISLLTIGVIVFSVTITSAQGNSQPLWRVQLDQYCTDLGFVGVEVDGAQNNVYGLGCKDNSGVRHGMNMVEVCRYLYGDSYLTPKYSDFNNPDSWRCYPTEDPSPTVAPENYPPQGGSGNSGNSGQGNNPPPQQPSSPSCGNGWCEESETCSSCSSDCGTCPAVVPPPPPQEQPSEESWCTGTFGLHAGVVAQVTPGLSNRLRSGPGLGYGVLGTIPPGNPLSIISGPSCSDGYTWWQVNYQGTVGWTAEGNGNEMWIERVGEEDGGEVWNSVQPADKVNIIIPPFCGPESVHAWVQFTIYGLFKYEGLKLQSMIPWGERLAADSQLLYHKSMPDGVEIIRMGLNCTDLFLLAPYQVAPLTDVDNWQLIYRVQ